MKTIVHTDKEFLESTIRECEVCYVGMVDTDGMPYVLPMNFGYQDGIVYLHSAREGRSIDILEQNPNVCLVFNPENKLVHQHPDVACSYRMRSKSVMGWGKVIFEEAFDLKVKSLNIIMKNYSNKQFEYSDPAIDNVKIWCVKLEKVTCKEFGAPHR
ncbi:MAG: pyridoxamine 5'-phosphate oxidase family protein [Tannerella sp.]|jgi:nitroimidazol reductase NimA-like FMN-containing flavoprotein (pyridoxamine 5'-phosphate oxidase superfamily)|nr:pyridoxamine 5'-phosphate oxidase family protein [Tannerella sp.]